MLWKNKVNVIFVNYTFLLTYLIYMTSSMNEVHCLCEASKIENIKNESIDKISSVKYISDTAEYYVCISISLILIIIGGIASGLTTGLMSLDSVQLRVLIQAGTDEERKWASSALRLIRKHHLLLVTLLLTNSICMEALPLFLDRIIPSWLAVLLSVTAILIFGEILPQAICTGKHQLKIAGNCSTFVDVLTFCLFLFSWPISKLLDYFIGDTNRTNNFYARTQLKALIALHRRTNDLKNKSISLVPFLSDTVENKKEGSNFVQMRIRENKNLNSIKISQNCLNDQYMTSKLMQPLINRESEVSVTRSQLKNIDFKSLNTENGLANDEVTIIQGVLDMANKSLLELSVPLEKVYMLHIDSKLDRSLLEDILRVGHSRIPIYSKNRHHIKGLLLVKSLITIDPDKSVTIKSLFNPKHCNRYIVEPIFAYPQTNPYDALNMFQQGRCHVAILTNYVKEYTDSTRDNVPLPEKCKIMGIATLEDIIEEIIQEEIIDEFDTYNYIENKDHSNNGNDQKLLRSSSFFKLNRRTISEYFNFGNKKATNKKYYKDYFTSAPDLWSPFQ